MFGLGGQSVHSAGGCPGGKGGGAGHPAWSSTKVAFVTLLFYNLKL